MKRRLILCLILGLALVAAACGSKDKANETVPFNLCEEMMMHPSNEAVLLRSKDEMTAFLADESVFTREPSQEFTEINNRYDDNYFKQNDLVALIIWASSGSYYGYHLGEPVERSGIWVIETTGLAHGNVVTHDMGKIFCYYVEVPKKAGVTGVSTTNSSNSDILIHRGEKQLTVVHMEGPGPDVMLPTALEDFYRDEEYVYSFPNIMSNVIICKLSDGSTMTFAEAFEKGIATIADLDAHGIKYYKTRKDLEISDR